MAEMWRQKQVDIEHWLHGIQSPSPEPPQGSDRELISSSDNSSPISSHQTRNSSPQTIPINETVSILTTTKALHSHNSFDSVLKPQGSPQLRAQRSPLPAATRIPRLPRFEPLDSDDNLSGEENLKAINYQINRPPSCPMIPVSSSDDPGSSPSGVRITIKKSSLLHATTLEESSRKKSLSQDNISLHMVDKQRKLSRERRISRERHCSDSNINKDPEPQTESDTESSTCAVLHSDSDPGNGTGGSLSSTGACGVGSDSSRTDSSPKPLAGPTPLQQKRKRFAKRLLSAASMDVLETRRRERKLGIGPTNLLSPTSPPPQPSPASRVVRSPSPSRPTSPYQTSIVPLSTQSPYHTRVAAEHHSGISKSKLKQFNISQQYSFDTTNDDEFNNPTRQPKFLKSNVLMGKSSHVRSKSDISSVVPVVSTKAGRISSSANLLDNSSQHYGSQQDLIIEEGATGRQADRKASIFEQIQLRKAETIASGGTAGKSKVLRQDSGLGTLSINS